MRRDATNVRRTREDPLKRSDSLLHLRLLLRLLLIPVSLDELVVATLELLVRLCLELAACTRELRNDRGMISK